MNRGGSREKFAQLRDARRVWAVSAIHGEARRLARVHDLIGERFFRGDRLVYLGNYLGHGEDVAAALAKLRGRSRAKRTMWSRRAQEYQAKIASGDPASIAEVVRDLFRNVGQPEQSYSERQIYQAALDRFVREFAAVERIDEITATQRVEQILSA